MAVQDFTCYNASNPSVPVFKKESSQYIYLFPQQLEGQKFLVENSASVYIQKVC